MDEEIIEVAEVETVEEIEVDEAIGWTSGDSTLHSSLAGRDALEQHPIKSIIGLKDMLDEAKTLKTVYSDEFGFANYYKWDSGAYDDYGYFVSLTSADTVKICDGTNIFGVTVGSAAFVGGQREAITEETDEYGMPKHLYTTDNTYALVVTNGLVDVRCVSDVGVGDYVVSDGRGVAIKTTSECGYKVVATETKDDVPYVVISLGVQACTTDVLGQRVKQLEADVDDAEINIAAAMRLATEACSMAGTSNTTSDETKEKVDNVVDAVDKVQVETDSIREELDKSRIDIDEAIFAVKAASDQASEVANNALSKAGEVEKTVAPLTTWEDPESGNVGAEYYVKYIEDGLSTKAEMEAVSKLDEENKLLIEKNAESYNQLISSVDKYSVGEYSQAYGLTLEQARNILKNGMVYIPTKHGNVETHTESYIYNETEKLDKDFTEGYYYIWSAQPDGEFMWGERIGAVWVNAEAPTGDAYTYWYDGNKLYLLNDGEWIEVATLAGNVGNRITSMIRQDVDSVTSEVVNARGSIAKIDQRVTNAEAAIEQNAFWKKDDGTEYVAAFRQVAGEGENEGASLSLIAYKTDGSGNDESVPIQGASFVVCAGADGNDYIDFKADNINLTADQITAIADEIDLTGYVTISDLSGEMQTKINGENIETGTIDASQITTGTLGADVLYAGDISAGQIVAGDIESKNYVSDYSGTKISLNNGVIDAAKFKVNSYGEITASGGTIGGWEITSDGIQKDSTCLLTGSIISYESLVNDGEASPVRFEIGRTVATEEVEVEVTSYNGVVDEVVQTHKELVGVEMVSYVDAAGDADKFAWEDPAITESGIVIRGEHTTGPYGDDAGLPVYVTLRYSYYDSTTRILDDGSLYAGAANIAGSVTATSGRIGSQEDGTGGWEINAGGITTTDTGMMSEGAVRFYSGASSAPITKTGTKKVTMTCGTAQTDSFIIENCSRIVSVGVDYTTDGGSANIAVTTAMPSDGDTIEYIYAGSGITVTATFTFEYMELTDATFVVFGDGTLHADGAVLSHCTLLGDASSLSLSGQGVIIGSEELDARSSYYVSGASGAYIRVPSADPSIPHPMMFGITNDDIDQNDSCIGTHGLYIYKNGHVTLHGDNGIGITADGGDMRIASDGEMQLVSNQSITLGSSSKTSLTNYMYGTWKLNDDAVVTSDRNLKHDIAPMDDKYADLFDGLRPVKFKYNNGTSDRYHTGFIAQNVCEATESAGLTTDDFAAYVEFANANDNGNECGLRYSEFIALCVNEIQKLKKRVAELEDKLNTTQND